MKLYLRYKFCRKKRNIHTYIKRGNALHKNISCLLTFHSWSKVYKLHMPQFSAFEVCVEHVCRFPRCPSSHWELEFVRGGVTHSVTHVTAWCQVDRACDVSARCQVGNHLNNASCPALALAGAPLWSVPETSVAWVFNHLACTSLLPINPSPSPSQPTSLSPSSPRRN